MQMLFDHQMMHTIGIYIQASKLIDCANGVKQPLKYHAACSACLHIHVCCIVCSSSTCKAGDANAHIKVLKSKALSVCQPHVLGC